MKVLKSVFVFLLFLVLAVGCTEPGVNQKSNNHVKNSSEEETGTVKLSINDDSIANSAETRSINLGAIQYYHVVFHTEQSGNLIDEDISATKIGSREFTLKVEKNVTVIIEPLDLNKKAIFGDHKIAGYGDIIRAKTSVIEVSWERTPIALSLHYLKKSGKSVQNLSGISDIQDNINTLWTNSPLRQSSSGTGEIFNPLAVDIETLADNIESGNTASSIPEFTLKTVTVNIMGYSNIDKDGMTAFINEPFASPITLDLSTDKFVFENIAPGTWDINLINDTEGSTTVIVPKTGDNITATINKVNNKPAILDWAFTAFNNKGVEQVIVSADIDDEDKDPLTITLTSSTINTDLSNDGNSYFFDTKQDDSLYEKILENDNSTDSFVLTVNDGQEIYSETKNISLNYLNTPTITSPGENEVITENKVTINWEGVDGAKYYTVRLFKDGIEESIIDNISSTENHTVINNLEDNNYSIEIYAHSDKWIFPNSTGYLKSMSSMSLNTITFTINSNGTIANKAPNLGRTRIIYYTRPDDNVIFKYDLIDLKETPLYYAKTPIVFNGISPDGAVLLFTENGFLHKIRWNGKAKSPLFRRDSEPVSNAKWSPDGKYIALVADNKLYTITPDGSNRTFLDEVISSKFEFSLDSSTIFYLTESGICSINIDGNNKSTIYNKSVPENKHHLELSHDGSRILLYYNKTLITIGTDGNDYIGFDTINADFDKIKWLHDGRIIYLYNSSKYIYTIEDKNRSTPKNTWLRSYPEIKNFFLTPSGKEILVKTYDSHYYSLKYFPTESLNKNYIYTTDSTHVYCEAITEIFISPLTW